MGKIVLNTSKGKVNVLIEGDKPTIEEQIKINNIIRDASRGNPISKDQTSTTQKIEQLFDTNTGIKSNALRSALSVAETNEEEEAILKKFDLSQDDFLRDNRGRLALTPTGAAKFGQETDKNILIDEEGFSRYDFSDLAGIAPELIGGIGGAITGQLAIPIPILGAAIGAGLGAGSGQAVEEVGEAIAGVQKQNVDEVFDDVKREAAVGFFGDLTFGLAAGAFRLARRSVTPGKDLTKPEMDIAGQSISEPIDEAGNIISPQEFARLSPDEQIAATTREVTKPDGTVVRGGFGVRPTLSAIRAPSIVARIQAIGEKIFKTSDRLKNNNDKIRTIINAYKEKYGTADNITAVDVGQILKDGMVKNNKNILKTEELIQKKITEHMKNSAEQFKSASKFNQNVDDDLFEIMRESSLAFDNFVSKKFQAVDDVLRDSSLGTAKVFKMETFKSSIDDILRDFAPQIANRGDLDGRAFSNITDAFKSLGEEASFTQLYNLRKTISDLRMGASNTVKSRLVNESKTGLLDDLDNVFKQLGDESSDVFRNLSNRIVGDTSRVKFQNAGEALKKAQTEFFLGKNILEDLHASTSIKNLDKYKPTPGEIDNVPMNIDIYRNVVKSNNPQFLQRALEFIKSHGGRLDRAGNVIKGTGDEMAEEFRARAANQLIEDAIENSGLKNFTNTKNFNAEKFANTIKGLGSTAKVLFGDQTDQILKLADEIGSVKITGLQSDRLLNNFRNIAEDTASNRGLLRKLERLANLQKRQVANQKNRIITKLQSDVGDLDPLEAASFLAQKQTKNSEIKPIIKYFRNQGASGEQSLAKIQSYYINSMIDDFGESIMTDGKSLNAFADRMLAAAADGKLQTIFGETLGKNMERFAEILKFNARSAEGGDLVAANIAASPFQNIGKLLKFSVLGNRFLSNGYYSDIIQQYNGITLKAFKKPADRAKDLGSRIGKALSQSTAQTIQNTYTEAEDQAKAVLENKGVFDELNKVSSQITPSINQTTANLNQASGLNIPNIQPPASGTQVAGIDISNPANAFSLGLSPSNVAIAQRRQRTV
jgi:hypothetical protein